MADSAANGRARRAALAVLVGLVAASGLVMVLTFGPERALAQTDTTLVPDAGPTTVIPTTPPPTAAPACVPTAAPTDVVFLGIMLERDADVVRFDVRSVQQGPELPTVVGVTFGSDGRYLDPGEAYRVTATPSPEGGYSGQLRQPEGACLPLTLTASGSRVDTSVFGRLIDRWPRILWAFFVPLAVVLLVLLAVVGLKRLVAWAFR